MFKNIDIKRFSFRLVITLLLLAGIGIQPEHLDVLAQNQESYYLPILFNRYPAPPPSQINIPYFASGSITGDHFSEMGIFWFGRVTSSENYADIRIGYNNQALVLYAAVFDRLLWYDESPSNADLKNWDAMTVYLDTVNTNSTTLTLNSYQFIAQFSRVPEANLRSQYQAAYKWNGSNWALLSTPYQTTAGWRGNETNDNLDDRGWAMTFTIPFTSLGLAGKPANGQIFRMGITLHDRDSQGGPALAEKAWPTNLVTAQPESWGYIHFGYPAFSPPSATNVKTTTIRHKLNGAVVPDADVGGTTANLCGGNTDFWTEWGNMNYGFSTDFNIQNQSDIADWPCFSKYYVTFPLTQIPANKQIVSAQLKLYHYSNSGAIGLATPSFIHVMTVSGGWNENSITWNNAPLVRENIDAIWVPVQTGCNFPCTPRVWDVSRAVVQAYQEGTPLRLALYSTDSDYHSGKFFTPSDTGDWNAAGRPTLEVVWGDP